MLAQPVRQTAQLRITFRGSSLKLLCKLPMDRAEVNSIGPFRPLTLFHRSRAVIVGIVRHDEKTQTVRVPSHALQSYSLVGLMPFDL